jgi:hypothetical protein
MRIEPQYRSKTNALGIIKRHREGRLEFGPVGWTRLPFPLSDKEYQECRLAGVSVPFELLPSSYWRNPKTGRLRFDETALGDDF